MFQIPNKTSRENVTSNNLGQHPVRQKTYSLTKQHLIYLLILVTTLLHGQTPKNDSVKKYEYEVCVYKKGKIGQVIKNQTIGIGDTTTAFIGGQVIEKKEPVPFVNVSFTNSSGQKVGTYTDNEGYYKIHLKKGNYVVSYKYIGYTEFKIEEVKLDSGQMQEIIVDLGTAQGYHSYLLSFKKPLSDKELKKLEKKLSDD